MIAQDHDNLLGSVHGEATVNGLIPPGGAHADLPRGTVTFLFTDIVGSTRMAEASPEAYREQLEAHRQIVRATVTAHSGHVIGHEGDSFFIAFERATDAAAVAQGARRELEEKIPTLQVRFGIHTGEVIVTDDGYVGLPIHQARRICDAANGSQNLLSPTTVSLVAGLPEGTVFADLGHHRLKDLGDPVHLFELRRTDAGDSPRPRTLSVVPNNLPILLTNMVGRGPQVERILGLVQSSRLVTITGFGGIGKTRLAYEVASRSLDLFPDGVWSVQLTGISDPALVPSTAARALGVGRHDGRDSGSRGTPTEQIANRLGVTQTLLLIDNCEHVIEECAALVHDLMVSCPALTVLTTSRQPLAVQGEAVYPLGPLETSSPEGAASEAVDMFIQRALTRDPGLMTTATEDMQAIEALCLALDGIPLAIELAASRVSSMSPKEILDQFRESPLEFGIGTRTVAERHRTLRAAIDWSYDLLSEPERLLLRRLTFMSGTFTAEAAREVCADKGLSSKEVPELLASLVDKSLLIPVRSKSATTFRMLDSIKAYASEKLLATIEAPVPYANVAVLKCIFKQEGDVWAVGEPGAESRVRATRGFPLLLRLLENPGVEIHALDLMGLSSSPRNTPAGFTLDPGPGLETLDARARDQLRKRLEDLADDLREAEDLNDIEKRSLIETEMQQITDHLSEALGLGGRSRKTGSNAERARLAATKAIRSAIARISAHDEKIGGLLAHSIRTGTYCSYEPPPVPTIEWAF